MSVDRYQCFPSRMVKAQFETRLKSAQTGHRLLKKKSDALKSRLHGLLQKILEAKQQMGNVFQAAILAHIRAEHAAGDFNDLVINSVAGPPSSRIVTQTENLTGVKIPAFRKDKDAVNDETTLGLAKGGRKIADCRNKFAECVDVLVALGTLQTQLLAIDEALKVTNRRVNALEFVVIPKIKATLRFIRLSLEEKRREETFRLKKIQDKKQVEQAEKELERKRERRARALRETTASVSSSSAVDEIPEMDELDAPSLLDTYGASTDDVVDDLGL
ncbi:MAG: hypothetical protein MHM6MM_006654 [Cercozoa sp. M6MM]